MKAISAAMVQAHRTQSDAYDAEYQYYPTGPVPPEFAKRRFEFGKAYYTKLHVDHGDLEGRRRVSLRNL